MTAILLFILAELLLLIWVGNKEYVNYLVGFVVTKLVYISIFAPVLLSILGVVTNVGTLLYGSVMTAQCIVLYRFGEKVTYRILENSLSVLFVVFLLGVFISSLPILPGNESFMLAAQSLLEFSPLNVIASFFAFFIGQYALIYIFTRLKKVQLLLRTFISISLAQIIDSLIFFPIAFSGVPGWWGIMTSGFILKIALAAFYLPSIYFATKNTNEYV